MTRRQPAASISAAFARVEKAGRALPHVEAATRYDGARILKARGCFMAGQATHPSAEADSLVLRIGLAERRLLIEDAPETYYVTEYYDGIQSSWPGWRHSTRRRYASCCGCRGG